MNLRAGASVIAEPPTSAAHTSPLATSATTGDVALATNPARTLPYTGLLW